MGYTAAAFHSDRREKMLCCVKAVYTTDTLPYAVYLKYSYY